MQLSNVRFLDFGEGEKTALLERIERELPALKTTLAKPASAWGGQPTRASEWRFLSKLPPAVPMVELMKAQQKRSVAMLQLAWPAFWPLGRDYCSR